MSTINPVTPPRARGHRHGHTRSLSNPFSGIGIGKRRKSLSRHDFLDSDDDDDDDDVTFPLPEVSTSASPSASSPKKPLPPLPEELVTGRCMTCNSAIRWPKNLTVFRCSVCLMVNDLEVAVESKGEADAKGKEKAGKVPGGAQRAIPRKGWCLAVYLPFGYIGSSC